jgi:UDP-N-acetylmuramyl pentapeptide phosphotransferase/UDP-N-acetylglucosamine-1-phosphate transferase
MTPTTTWGIVFILLWTLVLTLIARRFGPVRALLFGPGRGTKVSALGGLPLLLGLALPLLYFFGDWRCSDFPSDIVHHPEDLWRFSLGLILAMSLLFMEGLYADYRGARQWRRLVFLVLSAAVMCWSGLVVDKVGILGREIDLGVWAVPLTMIWILVLLAFFRSLDGLDGLSSGLALLIVGFQLFLLWGAEEGLSLEYCLIITLVLVAVFSQELYPARLVLGRNGHFLPGLMVAASTILTRQKSFVAAALFLPALIVFITLGVLALKVLEKRLLYSERR